MCREPDPSLGHTARQSHVARTSAERWIGRCRRRKMLERIDDCMPLAVHQNLLARCAGRKKSDLETRSGLPPRASEDHFEKDHGTIERLYRRHFPDGNGAWVVAIKGRPSRSLNFEQVFAGFQIVARDRQPGPATDRLENML